MTTKTAKIGRRGAVVVPSNLRRQFGMEEGTSVTFEERQDGILIRPAVVLPLETYTPQRKAEFLLSNAVDARATHLLTGDKRHFGRYCGRRVPGLLVLPPSGYCRTGPE